MACDLVVPVSRLPVGQTFGELTIHDEVGLLGPLRFGEKVGDIICNGGGIVGRAMGALPSS